MSDFINTIDILGDNAVCNSIIQKTVTEFKDNVITSVEKNAFVECSELVSVVLPSVVSIDNGVFRSCTKLTSLDLLSVAKIGDAAINGCSSLQALIVRSDAVCSISYNNFSNPGLLQAGGYIYVPRELMESYKTASNWNLASGRFRALEDYTVDGTITGELDETKI